MTNEDGEFVTVERATEPGQFYVTRASEIASGERVLSAGEEITAARAAVLAAIHSGTPVLGVRGVRVVGTETLTPQ